MLLPLISERRENGNPGGKNIGICPQTDAVIIDVDHNSKPKMKITTTSAVGDVSRLASARSGSLEPCSPPTRAAGRHANDTLRYLAGNFYVNDESARWCTYSPMCGA
jgi:hypothetical protein